MICQVRLMGFQCENEEPEHTTHFVDDLTGKVQALMERVSAR